MSNFDTYALISYATNEGSDEPVHFSQSRQSLHSSNTQSLEGGSNQNLDI